MSKGVFTVIDSYLGKQELHLTASKLLYDRLNAIKNERLDAGGWTDPVEAMPTQRDIAVTHMLYVKRIFKPFVAFAYEYFKSTSDQGATSVLPDSASDSSVMRFNLRANNGDFVHDQVLRVVLPALGSATSTTLYRYTDFPGIRMIKEVKLSADSVDVYSYNTDDVLMYMNTRLDEAHRKSFEQLVGQEQTHEGVFYHENRNINQVINIRDGAQTFKRYQPELELWIPLIFDYNSDVGRSLHNRVIGSQQMFIDIVLENVTNIIQTADINAVPTGSISKAKIKTMELYTKNIYLNPEINDLFTDRNNLALIRVYRQHKTTISINNDDILLSSLKFPIEIMHFGFRPNVNCDVNANPKYAFKDWHKFSTITRHCVPVPALIDSVASPGDQKLVVRTARYSTEGHTVSSIGLRIHGNDLYPLISSGFFEKYQLNTSPGLYPSDARGCYTANFCHYPTLFSPSGHINNSTARELYIKYVAENISTSNMVTFVASAQCINFILMKNNSVKLRYIA